MFLLTWFDTVFIARDLQLCTTCCVCLLLHRGGSRISKWGGGGGANDYVRKREVPYWSGLVQCPHKGPGSSGVLYALSCYVSLILKHSDTKQDTKRRKK